MTGTEPESSAGPEAAFAVFRVGGAWLAVPAERTQRFVELPLVAPVPLAPPALLGVANAGGRLLSVLDLALLLGLARTEKSGARCLVVSAAGDGVALNVDAVDGVRMVPEAEVRAAGEDGRGFSAGTFTLAERHVTVIDVERMVESLEASMPGH